jgi:2-polyprenyl-3-methyl-5-hydroxy-6-metoxy-1,4-benzoquinol methylase
VAEHVGRAFESKAGIWDDIYSGEKGALKSAWNRLTRGNIRRRHEFAVEALSPVEGKRILDAGCGSGRSSIDLAERGAGEVVGLDLASNMLAIARKLAAEHDVESTCRFIEGGLLDHEVDDPYDGVIALGVFDYLPDMAKNLAHLASLSKGPVVVSFPSLWALRVPVRWVWWKLHGVTVRYWTRRKVEALCRDAGVEIERLVSTQAGGPLQLLVVRGTGRTA